MCIRDSLYAHAGEDRDRHRQRRAPETRHIVDRGDSGDWIAHSETPGKGLDGGKTSEEGFSFPRPLSLPKTFDLFKGCLLYTSRAGRPHEGDALPGLYRKRNAPERGRALIAVVQAHVTEGQLAERLVQRQRASAFGLEGRRCV